MGDTSWMRMVELEGETDRLRDHFAAAIADFRAFLPRSGPGTPDFTVSRADRRFRDRRFENYPRLDAFFDPERRESPPPRSRLFRSFTLDDLAEHPDRAERLLELETSYDEQVHRLQSPWTDEQREALLVRAASVIESPVFPHPEGVLGAWSPHDETVLLYPWMMELAARQHGWDVTELETVALLHETAHAVITSGLDSAGAQWLDWSATTLAMHEVMACLITEEAAMAISGPLAMLAREIAKRAVPEAELARRWPAPTSQLIASVRHGWLSPDPERHARAVRALLSGHGMVDDLWMMLDNLPPLEQGVVVSAALVWACDGELAAADESFRLDLERVRRAVSRSRDAVRRVDRPAGGLETLVFDHRSFMAAIQPSAPEPEQALVQKRGRRSRRKRATT